MIERERVHRFLTDKLGCNWVQGQSSDTYTFDGGSDSVFAPFCATLPRRVEVIPHTHLKQLAAMLGLTLGGLQTGTGCGLRASCVRLCVCARNVGAGLQMHRYDPVAHQHVPGSLNRMIDRFLEAIPSEKPDWNHHEDEALRAVKRSHLDPFEGHTRAVVKLKRWHSLAGIV